MRCRSFEPRSQKGSANNYAKLGWAEVREIRKLAGTATQETIAKRFGIHPSTVSLIVANESWHDPAYHHRAARRGGSKE